MSAEGLRTDTQDEDKLVRLTPEPSSTVHLVTFYSKRLLYLISGETKVGVSLPPAGCRSHQRSAHDEGGTAAKLYPFRKKSQSYCCLLGLCIGKILAI